MIVVVQGTSSFSDYSIFLRAMGTAMSMMDTEIDKEILVYSAGPYNINTMALEFVNVSERNLKARGISIKFKKAHPSLIKQEIYNIGYFIFLSKPKEPLSDLVKFAESKDIEVGVYRY